VKSAENTYFVICVNVLVYKKYGAIDNFEKDETEGKRSEIVNVVSFF